MARLKMGSKYIIGGIEGEFYNDCKFIFGSYIITSVDDQYFKVSFKISNPELNETWWDSEGFKITEIK